MGTDAVIVICSTLESKRVPKKAVKVIADYTVMEHILHRVTKAGLPVILAVPEGRGNAEVYQRFIDKHKTVKFYQGINSSPLHRMADAVRYFYGKKLPKYVIRVTHDDMLIDMEEMKELLKCCKKAKAGYGYSKGIMDGAGVEVIATENLMYAANRHSFPIEHISYFVKNDVVPNSIVVAHEPRASIKRDYRMTMDYHEDAVLIEAVLRKVGAFASADEVCKFLDDHRWMTDYNRLPLLTVYTCVYNNTTYLRDTVFSIMQMSGYVDFEYIIVNDGSDNGALADIVSLATCYAGKIKIISNEHNLGLASSSNKALAASRGRYIMRVDADDVLCAGSMQEMLNEIVNEEAAAVYCNYDEIDGEGNTLREDVDARENHHVGCALMDKKVLNELKFKEGLRHWDSLELYKRLKGEFRIAYLDIPLWMYRRHKDCMSMNNLKERKKVLRRIGQ